MDLITDILAFLLVMASVQSQRRQVNVDSEDRCKTPRSETGRCINIKECPSLLELLKNNNKPGTVDYLRRSVCRYEGSIPIVCCPGGSPSTNPKPQEETQLEGNSEYPNLPTPGQCGSSSVGDSIRIVGGEPAQLGAWPWIAALGYQTKKNPGPLWLCGGTLITDQHVVTAAHCTKSRNNKLYMVRLGDLDLNDAVSDGASPMNVRVDSVIAHPRYSPTKFQEDIAIVRLQHKVQFNKLIHPICLPTAAELRANDFVNYYPFTAGWGALGYRTPGTVTGLRQVQIPVVKNSGCGEAYKSKGAAIIDKQLCAGFARGGKDACQGDSGGPLMLPRGATFYLIGVVSYGHKCAEPGFPGIYTRITHYIDWIAENVN